MSTPQTTKPNLIIACGALGKEVMALLKQIGQDKEQVMLQCLPAHYHNTPEKIAPGIEAILAEKRQDYQSVLVAYGECGTGGALDKVLQAYDAQRIDAAHCYEFYAGTEAFNNIIENDIGSFFLTDYLVKNFDRLVFQYLGLDRFPHLRDMYFGNYTKMVYLAQVHDDELVKKAQAAADSVGLELLHKPVGYGDLQTAIKQTSLFSGIPVQSYNRSG